MALIHGGQLQQIAAQYKIPVTDWLDLSTGIAPLSYPIPEIPTHIWQQLPQTSPCLISAAKHYYQCETLIVTNGSQAIIKALPQLWQLKNSTVNKVYLPEKGYKEHAHAWHNAGYQLCYYHDELPEIAELSAHCVLVIINPNNPTGKFFDKKVLTRYQKAIKALKGLLIIDEAFIDIVSSEQSMCAQVNDEHTLVLRSFGKFFGLAGIRIGFLVANEYWYQLFSEHLGPWQVNGPAQFIAQHALQNKQWHYQQQQHLQTLRQQQEQLLWETFDRKLVTQINGTHLFLTVGFHQQHIAKEIYVRLCQQGVYVRLTDEQDSLRFGITTQSNFTRLKNAILTGCKSLK